jgi:hypothetical protein
MQGQLIIVEYEPDNLGGVILHCRREGQDERVSNCRVCFGKWGIYRGASSGLKPLTRDEISYLQAKATAYLSRKPVSS